MKNNTLYENHTPKQLLEICSELYDQGKYEEVINMLENIAEYVSEENEKDDDITSLILTLGLSYDRMGDITEENIYYEKNVNHLLHFIKLLHSSFLWHLLMGKSYYMLDKLEDALLHLEMSSLLCPDDIDSTFYLAEVYRLLDQEPKALEYYQRLLEFDENDEMNELAKENINLCILGLSKPHFQKSFKQRVEHVWKLFEEQEETIRQLHDQYETIGDEGEAEEFYCNKVLPVIKKIFTIAIENPYFDSKKENGKYHLYLSTMGFYFRIPLYAYFIDKMPKSLHQYWNIEFGLPMKKELKMSIDETVIEGNEFSFWVEEINEELSVSVFSEKLVPSIKENKIRAYIKVLQLLMETLGEVAVARLKEIQDVRFELLIQPPKTKSSIFSNLFTRGKKSSENQEITLFELKETLEQKGYVVSNNLEEYLQLTYSYENEPEEMGDDWKFRDDIKYSTSRMPQLEWDYEDNNTNIFDIFYGMGVVAGFLSLPTENFLEGDMVSGEQLEELIDKLLAYIEENAGSDVITIIGRSMGMYCMYIDFIAWDINAVLETAHNFFKETEFDWVNYHSYRAGTNLIRLYENKRGINDEK